MNSISSDLKKYLFCTYSEGVYSFMLHTVPNIWLETVKLYFTGNSKKNDPPLKMKIVTLFVSAKITLYSLLHFLFSVTTYVCV